MGWLWAGRVGLGECFSVRERGIGAAPLGRRLKGTATERRRSGGGKRNCPGDHFLIGWCVLRGRRGLLWIGCRGEVGWMGISVV